MWEDPSPSLISDSSESIPQVLCLLPSPLPDSCPRGAWDRTEPSTQEPPSPMAQQGRAGPGRAAAAPWAPPFPRQPAGSGQGPAGEARGRRRRRRAGQGRAGRGEGRAKAAERAAGGAASLICAAPRRGAPADKGGLQPAAGPRTQVPLVQGCRCAAATGRPAGSRPPAPPASSPAFLQPRPPALLRLRAARGEPWARQPAAQQPCPGQQVSSGFGRSARLPPGAGGLGGQLQRINFKMRVLAKI